MITEASAKIDELSEKMSSRRASRQEEAESAQQPKTRFGKKARNRNNDDEDSKSIERFR